MRRAIVLTMCIALMLVIGFPSYAQKTDETKPLSEMTDTECLRFLEEYGIAIPNEYLSTEMVDGFLDYAMHVEPFRKFCVWLYCTAKVNR